MDIITTKFTRLPKMLLYGVQGMGKSTFASEMPAPVFIQTTDGLEGLGVQAFPLAQTAEDVRNALHSVLNDKHDFKTLVIDTIGWLEKLIHAEVCGQLGLEYMTQASVKSYPLAKTKLFEMKQLWDRINTERKMFILLVGHATIQKFEDPTTASYDRYQVDMNDKCAEMLLQDVDIVAFMNQKVAIKTEDLGCGKEAVNGQASARYVFCHPRPAVFAKEHNYGLPPEILIKEGQQWNAVWDVMKTKFKQPAKKKDLKEVADQTKAAQADKAAAAIQQ